jgi:hypothetical protein
LLIATFLERGKALDGSGWSARIEAGEKPLV